MQRYPDKPVTVKALLAAAEAAAWNTTGEHPEDISAAMSLAIDSSWAAVQKLFEELNETA